MEAVLAGHAVNEVLHRYVGPDACVGFATRLFLKCYPLLVKNVPLSCSHRKMKMFYICERAATN